MNWFSQKRSPTTELDDLRNGAVAAWIKTFPVDERLQGFLANVPSSFHNDVREAATSILNEASAYLETAAGVGVVNLDQFYPELEAHLQSKFPWMNDTAFAALRSYTGWYAWHEGYSAETG